MGYMVGTSWEREGLKEGTVGRLAAELWKQSA